MILSSSEGWKTALSAAIVPFLLTAPPAILCYFAAGPSLGFFMGGVVIVAIAVPFVALSETGFIRILLASATVVDTVAMIWLVALSRISFMQWLQAYLLLACFGFALLGMSILVSGSRIPAIFTSAIVTTLALLWLSWPIWLSPWTGGRDELVSFLSAPHPLLSFDGFLHSLDAPWPEARLMYRHLSNLNQDVIYHPPRSALQAALLHAFIGGIALAAATLLPPQLKRLAGSAAS